MGDIYSMAQSDIICYDNTLAELDKQSVAKKLDANTERIKSWNCKMAPEAPVTSATRSEIRTDARKFLAGEVKAVRHAIVQREVAICNKRKAEIEEEQRKMKEEVDAHIRAVNDDMLDRKQVYEQERQKHSDQMLTDHHSAPPTLYPFRKIRNKA